MSETPHTYGIIGSPLDRSLSPRLFAALFRRLHLPAVYLPLPIAASQLAVVPQCMRLLDIAGLNVTAPYKVAILRHLDAVDPEAARIGAVNTIVLRRGRAIGHNTDARGFLAALRHELGMHPRGLRVAIVGTGGAACAVGAALCHGGTAAIRLYHRSPVRARTLLRHLQSLTAVPCHMSMAALTPTTWREALTMHDLIIQASAAPFQGRGALPWPSRCRPKASALFDLRYGPRNPLVAAARAHGCRATDGLEMLLQQAAFSFHLWTRHTADLGYWRRVARRALRER